MGEELADLGPDEELLAGSWTEPGVGSVHDQVDRRILWLVSRRLTLLGVTEGGWRQLYQDPRDGRFWELTFPHGSLHGGGPRRLECVAALVAAQRYGMKLD
ncbi:MAG: Imm27 family immunity protein [Gemmatimonadaceae bacterium]